MSRSAYLLIRSGNILAEAMNQLGRAGFTRIENPEKRAVLHFINRDDHSFWVETREKPMLRAKSMPGLWSWIDPEEQPGTYSQDHYAKIHGVFVRHTKPWDVTDHGKFDGPHESEELALVWARGQ